MGDHSDIDHTGLAGVGGSVATDVIFDAKGDLAVGTGANTSAKLTVGANDTIPMADSGQSTGIKWVASQTPSTQAFSDAAAEGTADTYARGDHKHAMPANPGGGSSYGQTEPYPSSLSGNDDGMSATTNWVDVDAFTAKAIQDSTVLHLQTVGASQDDRVRYTLGTTRAAAFDFRFYGVTFSAQHWSGDFDTYLEIYLTTSAPAGMAMCRFGVQNSLHGNKLIRFGQTSVVTTNTANVIPGQMSLDIRFVRDGSNIVTFYTRQVGGTGWHKVLKTSDNTEYSVTSSGTIARVELSIHTPSGPGGGQHVCDAYIDTFKDAS